MPKLRTYSIFISHGWGYSNDYKRLVKLLDRAQLDRAQHFKWKNYSDPKHDPVIGPDTNIARKEMREELDDQIRPVHCVIVISGMYVPPSYWIQTEIDIANRYQKPIIGVRPWGQKRIPQAVHDVALKMVGWNTNSIVAAVRKHALKPRN